jgi:superfamily II DNA or RNA helicase
MYNPGVSVGLQVALGEFKMELFKDGMSIAVLSAPPGCGKTTSAKLPCHVSYRQNYLVMCHVNAFLFM